MRKNKFFIFILILALSVLPVLTACGNEDGGNTPCTTHTDSNDDNLCDICGEVIGSKQECTTHTDSDGNNLCDTCNETMPAKKNYESIVIDTTSSNLLKYNYTAGKKVSVDVTFKIETRDYAGELTFEFPSTNGTTVLTETVSKNFVRYPYYTYAITQTHSETEYYSDIAVKIKVGDEIIKSIPLRIDHYGTFSHLSFFML